MEGQGTVIGSTGSCSAYVSQKLLLIKAAQQQFICQWLMLELSAMGTWLDTRQTHDNAHTITVSCSQNSQKCTRNSGDLDR